MVGLHVISFSIVRCTIGTSMMIFDSELRCKCFGIIIFLIKNFDGINV